MVQEINAVAKPALVVNIETMPVMKFSNEQHLYGALLERWLCKWKVGSSSHSAGTRSF